MPRARSKPIPWSAQDLKTLRKLAGRTSTARIARQLRRTVLAVRFKAHTRRISLALKRGR